MRKDDLIGGLVWSILGVGICFMAVQLKLGNFHKPGPGFMPFLSGAFLGVTGMILAFVSILKQLREHEESERENIWVKERWKKVLYPLFALFGYIILLDPIGFHITTFVFLFFLFKLTSPKQWGMSLFLSGGTVILSYLIFSVWLKCQFPRGVLGF